MDLFYLLQLSNEELERGDYVVWDRFANRETLMTFSGVTVIRKVQNADNAPTCRKGQEDCSRFE